MKYVLLAASIFSFTQIQAKEVVVDLPSGAMKAFRIHTNEHAIHSARDMAFIKVSGLEGGCESGVYLEANADQAALSVILSAYVSKAPVSLAYETTKKSPWGDLSFCALTYFDIK